jgi:hypothetical protein
LGSCLALFALAFQLAVSFGHVHLDRAALGRQQALLGIDRTAVATTAPDPAHGKIPAHADEGCAICALIHVAGSAVTAEPSPLPLPSYAVRLQFAYFAEFNLTRRPVARLRARAPPIA